MWIGAWGALAAVMFGLTGFVLNHRSLLRIAQPEPVEVARVQLPVPEAARRSQAALRDWLQVSQGMAFQIQRGGPPREPGPLPARWLLSSGNARATTTAEYEPSAASLVLRTTVQGPLGIMSRLHKGIGGGIPWILLSDSFALGMLMLGVSGLVMWSRGRSLRHLMFSVLGTALVLIVAVIGGAVI